MAIAWNFRKIILQEAFKLHELETLMASPSKSLVYSILLTLFVFSPYMITIQQPQPGTFYLISAIFLSLYLLFPAIRFFTSQDRDHSAKKLFFVTIIYLPLLFAALVIDRYL